MDHYDVVIAQAKGVAERWRKEVKQVVLSQVTLI
jgi:hypothetical protein